MWGIAFWFAAAVLGHVVTDLSFYSVHRWVLHGPLGSLPGLRSLKMHHAKHHAQPKKLGGLLFTPLANLMLLALGIAFVHYILPFGIGYSAYIWLYSWRHGRAHMGYDDAVSDHHLIHHMVSPKWNFDIVYPLTDFLMGTSAYEAYEREKDFF